MPRTFIRPETQIKTIDVFDDTVAAGAALETTTFNMEQFLQGVISQIRRTLTGTAGDWFEDLVTPSTLEAGAQRGVNDLNDALHLVEKKRILRDVHLLVDVTVPASQNYVVLAAGELPSNTTAAVGSVSTLGTVVAAHGGTFGTHSLTEVAGPNAVSPKNLLLIVDGATRDPILSSGRTVYGLLHSESATDGHTITDTTPTRVQISFVRITAAGDDLEAVPVADIENKVVNYCYRERVRLEDLTEADFLRGAIVDTPAAAATTRQNVYDNQGVTAVEVTTNSTLDLNAAGIFWEIRDLVNATLFRITEGSTGGTTTVRLGTDVDTFDVDAIVNDFANGVRANTGGTRPVHVGVTDGVVETTAGDLRLFGFAEMFLDDGNQAGSTWAQTAGIKLSETTAEWDAFETNFGEVSLLNAIVQASNASEHRKVQAAFTTNVSANNDISGPAGDNNIDANLGDLSGGSFISDYDFFFNGKLLRNGANAAADEDIYPGTSLAAGQVRLEFNAKSNPGGADKLTLIAYA